MCFDIFAEVCDEPLDVVCLKIFRHLVVYESGSSSSDAISFIKGVIMPLMNSEEKQKFYFEAIE
jgi:hypothetical protein